jgi:hypothetical protein
VGVPHLYKNCVILFIAFYAAVIEFAFGVLERGVTESEPSVCDMCCNVEIVSCLLTGVMAHH